MWITADPWTKTTSDGGGDGAVAYDDDLQGSLPMAASVTNLDRTDVANSSVDLVVQADAYVNPVNGLFPAPWPADQLPDSVRYRYYILGITVAKCIQVSSS